MRLLKEVRQNLRNYHLKSGVFHFYRGEHGPAVDFLSRALSEDADLSAADRRVAVYYLVHTHMGAAAEFEAKGEPDRAIDHYQRALKVMPGYPDVEVRLAESYARREQMNDAIRHLESALESNPAYLDARLRLAFFLLGEGRLEDSRREFRVALQHRSELLRQRVEHAEEAMDRGQMIDTRELYQDAFREDTSQFKIHYEAGLGFMRTEKWIEAITELRAAISICPRFADVHNYLGVALAEAGERETSCESFRRSVEINPTYLVAWLNLAYSCHLLEDDEQARLCLQEVLEREPDSSPALHLAEQLAQSARPRGRSLTTQGDA